MQLAACNTRDPPHLRPQATQRGVRQCSTQHPTAGNVAKRIVRRRPQQTLKERAARQPVVRSGRAHGRVREGLEERSNEAACSGTDVGWCPREYPVSSPVSTPVSTPVSARGVPQ